MTERPPAPTETACPGSPRSDPHRASQALALARPSLTSEPQVSCSAAQSHRQAGRRLTHPLLGMEVFMEDHSIPLGRTGWGGSLTGRQKPVGAAGAGAALGGPEPSVSLRPWRLRLTGAPPAAALAATWAPQPQEPHSRDPIEGPVSFGHRPCSLTVPHFLDSDCSGQRPTVSLCPAARDPPVPAGGCCSAITVGQGGRSHQVTSSPDEALQTRGRWRGAPGCWWERLHAQWGPDSPLLSRSCLPTA